MSDSPLPLSFKFQTRDGTSATKDCRFTNFLVEMVKEGEIHLIKRPGFNVYDGTGWTGEPSLGSTQLPSGELLSFTGTANAGTNNATVKISAGFSLYTAFDLARTNTTNVALSNSNLTVTSIQTIASFGNAQSTSYKSTGNWYCEVTCTNMAQMIVGVSTSASTIVTANAVGTTAGDVAVCYFYNGNKYINATGSAYGATYATGDKIGVQWNATAGTVTFYKNGASQGVAASGLSGSYSPCVGIYVDTTARKAIGNFGNSTFQYAVPTGASGWLT
jgi:hypothetical protein